MIKEIEERVENFVVFPKNKVDQNIHTPFTMIKKIKKQKLYFPSKHYNLQIEITYI